MSCSSRLEAVSGSTLPLDFPAVGGRVSNSPGASSSNSFEAEQESLVDYTPRPRLSRPLHQLSH